MGFRTGRSRPVTPAEKKALIKKLGAANKAFDSRFVGANRDWFVEKVIDAAGASATVAAAEKKVTDAIANVTRLLKAYLKSGFGSTLKAKYSSFNMLTSRTQIMYGLVAEDTRFGETAWETYFLFILERRFRAIQRMVNYVNPNDVAFAYPSSTAQPPEPMQVNASASTYWTPTAPFALPFILNATGKADPVKATELLYDPHPKQHAKQSLFACDPALCSVLLDSLLVSRDAGQLLKALAGRHDQYLKIDNPFGHFANERTGQRLIAITSKDAPAQQNVDIEVGRIGPLAAFADPSVVTQQVLETDAYAPLPQATVQNPNLFLIVFEGQAQPFHVKQFNPKRRLIQADKLDALYPAGSKIYVTRKGNPLYLTLPFHFLSDGRPLLSLFEQKGVPAKDLSVGDHAYFLNHPLYLVYWPEGAWGGEHSLITEIGSRDSASSAFRSNIKLSGHGLEPMTLLEMAGEMLGKINLALPMIQAITRIHQRFLKAVATAGKNAEFDIKAGHPLARHSTSKVTFTEEPGPGGVKIHVFQYAMPYSFSYVSNGNTKKGGSSKGFVVKELAGNPDTFQIFNDDGTDLNIVPTQLLLVIYIGASGGDHSKPSNWGVPFFNPSLNQHSFHPLFKANDKTPTILVFDDLVKAKPLLVTDEVSDAFVTRPRTNFDPTYKAFLSSNGAI
jgi:hypothetical protein